MKKPIFIFVFFVFCIQYANAQAYLQIPSPIYILFENSITARAVKGLDGIVYDNHQDTGQRYDKYCFMSKKATGHVNTSRNQIYGGAAVCLATIDRANFTTIDSSQLSNYNIKTHDQLVDIFVNIPIRQQAQYFWDRDIYVVEPLRNNKYKIIKVLPVNN